MTHGIGPFGPLGTSEVVTRSFDFTNGLGVGEALTGTPTCVITVSSGVDATPQARLVEGPTLSGNVATVLIGTMLDGVVYRILIEVTTNIGQTLSMWIDQVCIGP